MIGEVARTTGMSASAIRFYESEGVLPEPERTQSGYRGYAPDSVDLVRFVSRLRSLELPLSEVREIVALRGDGKAPCQAVRTAIAGEVSDITRRIGDLKRLRSELLTLQEQAKDLPDDWPTVCVCNVIESAATTEGQQQ